MTVPQYPPPQHGYMAPPPPPRKSHRVRNIVLGTVGALVALIAIGSALSGTKTPANPAETTPAAATPTAPASPAATHPATAAAAPVKRVLIRFTGSGIKNSAPFNVGSGPLTVTYHFNCASQGQAGNFIADLLYGNQSSLSGDDQSIANDLAMSGAQTTTVYPQDPGRDYYLSVNSECSWRIRVSS